MGTIRGVGAVRLALRDGDTRAARLRVSTSTDGQHWRSAVTTMTSGETSGYETFGFASRRARFVRVRCNGTSAGPEDAVAEAQLYTSS